jgi:hypothetical protein
MTHSRLAAWILALAALFGIGFRIPVCANTASKLTATRNTRVIGFTYLTPFEASQPAKGVTATTHPPQIGRDC